MVAMDTGGAASRAKDSNRAELFFSGLKKKPASPLNDKAWRAVLSVGAGCLLFWALPIALSGASAGLRIGGASLIGVATWVLAVRLLFLDMRARVFWLIWLVLGIVPLITGPSGGSSAYLGAAFFSSIFLLFRQFSPYRHLTGGRQAAVFGLGLVLLLFLTVFWKGRLLSAGFAPASSTGAAGQSFMGPGLSVAFGFLRYSLASLRWFWILSLFRLIFTVRLHFMKLRPKLAVAALFLVVVPVILLVVLGTGALYTTLGESHAARARAILDDWAGQAGRDERFVGFLSDSSFAAVKAADVWQVAGDSPGWLPELQSALDAEGSPLSGNPPRAEAVYLWKDADIWLMVFKKPDTGKLSLAGCRLDKALLDRLAGLLKCDVIVSSSSPISLDFLGRNVELDQKSAEVLARQTAEDLARRRTAEKRVNLKGTYAPPQRPAEAAPQGGRPPFFGRPIFFGVAQFDVLTFARGAFKRQSLEFQLNRSLRTTWQELFSTSNPLGVVVLSVLVSLALVFLILEVLALTFGLRISGGITSAIRSLHQHMCCVTEGDLEAVVNIPNQDELGDLAASFNQMTAAIRQGREEAIARERLEKELETARGIQERLLPHRMPSFPGFEVSGTSLPSHEVGGDYFDFIDMETGHLAVAIADVSGKGIPAALLMANLQASLRAQELKPDAVFEIPGRLNAILVRNTDERNFVTFFYGVLDRRKATFTYSNAGHNPPILMRADGKVERLQEGGMLLGFLANQTYGQASVALEPGDLLVLFTDGITEAVNPEAADRSLRHFGEDRLIEVLRTNAARTAAEIQSAILSAVAGHTHDSAQGDDITLVVVKRSGQREALVYVS